MHADARASNVAFGPIAVSVRVRGMNMALSGQQAAHGLAHQPPIGTALGLGRDATHHPAEIGRCRRAGLGDGGTDKRLDLVLGELLRQELGEDGGLRLLRRGAILAAARRGTWRCSRGAA